MTNPCQLLTIVDAVFVYIFTQLILLGLYSFAASAPLHPLRTAVNPSHSFSLSLSLTLIQYSLSLSEHLEIIIIIIISLHSPPPILHSK